MKIEQLNHILKHFRFVIKDLLADRFIMRLDKTDFIIKFNKEDREITVSCDITFSEPYDGSSGDRYDELYRIYYNEALMEMDVNEIVN